MTPHEEAEDATRAKRRRPHKKEKTGCADCRKRRVKCSEERPSCRACSRRSVRCQYPKHTQPPIVQASAAFAPDEWNDSAAPPRQQGQIESISQSPASSASAGTPAQTLSFSALQNIPATSFGLHEMALLHHWTVSTSLSIFNTVEQSDLWQKELPHLAFKHPFLMYSILELATLHLAYLNPPGDKRHLVDASRYHSLTLQGFREAASDNSSDSREVLFIWSILNVMYVFAMSGQLGDDEDDSSRRKDRILGLEWIPMIRGISAIPRPAHNIPKNSPLYRIMSIGNWDELDPDKTPSPDDGYFCQARTSWKRSPDAQIYEDALHILRKCSLYTFQFEEMDHSDLQNWGYNRAWSGPLMFITFAPEAYFTLLRQRQPPALVLIAFFGALLQTVDYCWFMKGWGKNIVGVAGDLLGSYWRPSIEWPAQIVGLS